MENHGQQLISRKNIDSGKTDTMSNDIVPTLFLRFASISGRPILASSTIPLHAAEEVPVRDSDSGKVLRIPRSQSRERPHRLENRFGAMKQLILGDLIRNLE